MTHQVAANYMLPTILQTIPPAASKLKPTLAAGTAASPTSTATANSADGGLDTSFLNLLVKELQNQDPTAPMDSTAMVGQMISLNQLDQLISINQNLTPGSAITAATNGMSAARAVSAPAGVAGSSASSTLMPANGISPAPENGPLQMSNLFRSLHGSPTAPLEPMVQGSGNTGAPVPIVQPDFGLPGFSDISGGK